MPEKREEITTEGGLDVVGNYSIVARAIDQLHAQTSRSVSLSIRSHQIEASHKLGVAAIELHTGCYALAKAGPARDEQLIQADQLRAVSAASSGMKLHAGNGLNYHNVQAVAAIPDMRELNIGHSIMSRAIMVGMERAVREMKEATASTKKLKTTQPV